MDKSADPSASLMDMMKNLYQSGDDEMKKTIAEAWVSESILDNLTNSFHSKKVKTKKVVWALISCKNSCYRYSVLWVVLCNKKFSFPIQTLSNYAFHIFHR